MSVYIFLYTEVLYAGCIYIYNYILLDWSLDHYAVSLSLRIVFISKSVLTDVSMATPAFFWYPFAWNPLFILSLAVCMCLQVRGSLIDSLDRDLFFYPFGQSISFAWVIYPTYITRGWRCRSLYPQRMLDAPHLHWHFLPLQLLVLVSYLRVDGFLPFLYVCLHHELSHFVIFLFPVVDFSFLPGQIPWAFVVKLVWRCWVLLLLVFREVFDISILKS